MKRPVFDRFALFLAGCSVLAGIAGCRSTRSDADSSVTADSSDRTLFQYRGGAWTGGKAGSQAEADDPRQPSGFSAYRSDRTAQPPASPYASDPDVPPVPYRNPSGGPHLLTPPRGISPDELRTDESDEVTAKPTLKQRLAKLWRRRDTEDGRYDAADVAQRSPRDVPGTTAQNPQLTAVRRPDRMPPNNSSGDDRLVTQTQPPEAEPRLERPPRPLPVNTATTASRAPQVSRVSRSMAAVERRPSNHAVARGPVAQGDDSDPEALSQAEATTMRVVDPPVLQSPPSGVGLEPRRATARGLAIPEVRICRQVRGFDDIVAYDPRKLRQGQPILIYVELEDFRSVSTPRGYRTLTLSTLEVRTSDGDVLARQPLGTAVDLADTPRSEFFLTHQLTIPEDLPPGDYVFGLCVDDLLGHSSARAEIAVRVTEGRSPRGGTADISVSARSPAGFPR